MLDKYQNAELVKLAAEIKAVHYDEIAKLFFDLAEKMISGEMDLVKSLVTGLPKDAQPEYSSVLRQQHVSAVAQNTQDRMLIGSNLSILGGGYRNIKEAYEQMQRTGEFFPEADGGEKLDLDPEYTALELAANEHRE